MHLGERVLIADARARAAAEGEVREAGPLGGDALTSTVPGTNGTGDLKSQALEMSNVDLASEFADLITTQRGFQANARIITTSDEMLQEVVNLKR